MPLEAGPLEPLGDAAGGGVDEHIGERVAEEGEAAELSPIGAEAAAEVMPRLGKVNAPWLGWLERESLCRGRLERGLADEREVVRRRVILTGDTITVTVKGL